MGTPNSRPDGYLPRLPSEAYRGHAIVFWTHTAKNRTTGWIEPSFHATLRELMLHVAVREHLHCPIYVLMPDHIHLVWMGLAQESDQRRASVFLRQQLENESQITFQHQPYDHVLDEQERRHDAFIDVCSYVAQNPVRAGLVESAATWPYLGSIVPGYPTLHRNMPDFWELFWSIYNACVARGGVGKR